jgi:glycerol-3-phosphate acyltransferase PlsY|tara:strand:- start:412 stop:993 length:582 start_codon:yes stop_codon:yes gene_type:complete
MNIELAYVGIYSYIVGTIPFGLLITKIFLKKDIREVGSGNIGATNVLRTGKKSLGVATLLLDGLKAYISVKITLNFFPDYVYLSALLCFLGHIFPIWLKFNGGKGIAVYLGILFTFSVYLGFLFIISWAIIFYLSKYSSLSSLVSALMIFLFSIVLNNFNMSLFFFIIFIIVTYTHRENISRIKNKTENKTNF